MQIHTFELSIKISFQDYVQCRNVFFATAKGGPGCLCYEDKKAYLITCNFWANSGVIVYLHKVLCNFSTCDYSAYCLYLRINPSKVLGNFEPTALFSPSPENVASLEANLEKILLNFPIQFFFQDLSLCRVDLTQDRIVENEDAISAYMRLLKKGANTDRWKSDTFNDVEKDLHSFRRSNDRYQVTVYDKLFQIEQCGLSTCWDRPGKILRVETSVLTPGICHFKNTGRLIIDTWPQQLIYLNKNGNLLMWEILKRLIQPGDYFTLKRAADSIIFHLPGAKAEKLIEFLKEINRPSKVDVSTIKQKKNGKKRLRQLTDLNINPVTIDVRASCLFLPSLFPDLHNSEIES